MSLILTVIMMLSLAGCGRNADLSSVSRDPADSDGTVWFDEEAVALAGSVQGAYLEQRTGVLRYGKSTGSCFQILSYQTERQRLVYREQ